MVAATPAVLERPVREVPTPTILGRAVAAEWTRLWTVRSTWWALLGAAGLMLLLGFAFGQDFGSDAAAAEFGGGGVPVWIPGEIAIGVAQFALYVLVMLPVTAEYGTGAIRSTLQAVPRRGVLLLARTVVVTAVAAVAGVAFAAGAAGMALIGLGGYAEIVGGDVARSLGSVAVVVAVGSLITVGLGALLRSSAGTLTSVFLLMLVLPQLLPSLGIGWLATVGEHLPGYAALSLLEAFGLQMSGVRATVVLVAWVVAAVGAGAWSLLRRDAA